MSGNPKFIIAEKDGVELQFHEEYVPEAVDVTFDPTGTNFSATETQAAIVESKDIAVSLPRFPVGAVHNATLSNGQLVGVSNLVNTPLVVPVTSILAEITFYQDGGASKDGQYRFYKNTQTPGDLFFTWTLNNTTTAVAEHGVDYTSPSFAQGDLLLIYYDDTGSNHQDVSIQNYFQATE